ncbi:hypothetical protein ACIQU7_23465 [Streptomyces albidoflavus]
MKPSPAKLSDRAHRVLLELARRPDGAWVSVASIHTSLGLTSHQVRPALNELRVGGLAERQRVYVRTDTGLRTHRTSFRLIDTTSEAPR